MNDEALVREFQRTQEDEHFRMLVERHRDRTFRLLASVLGPGREGEAEELTQDVFVKVYQKLGAFRGESKFSSWLFRVAYNHALNYRSRLSFQARNVSEEVLDVIPSDKPEADPFKLAANSRVRSALKLCMAELPDLYRSALHLRYWMGMSVPEVSATLSVPEGTVKSYLHRARARLHALLQRRGVVDV